MAEWILCVGNLCFALALGDSKGQDDLEQYRPLNEEEKGIQNAAKGKSGRIPKFVNIN